MIPFPECVDSSTMTLTYTEAAFNTSQLFDGNTNHQGKRRKSNEINACPYCTACFKNPKALERHISCCHSGKKKSAECPVCFKHLRSKCSLQKHMLTHEPRSEWPFQCPLCFRRFQGRGDIPRHFKTTAHKYDPR